MYRTIRSLLLAIMFVWIAAGCGSAMQEQDSAPTRLIEPVMNRDGLDSYSSDFVIHFEGATSWTYRLQTRRSGGTREMTLHIEGVPLEQNPGDLRLLTDGTRTWMKGPGTDEECITFPNGQGMDPSLILPESLVSLPVLGNAMTLVGEEPVNAVQTHHFQAEKAANGPWRDAAVDLWQAKDGGMLYRFTMRAAGVDPFFGAGSGTLSADYTAGPLIDDLIPPVEGCEISVRLPERVSMYVRLPGMASYETTISAQELVAFYQSILSQENWIENEPPAQAEGATVLSYHRGSDQVEIQIEPAEGGSIVRILFIQ